MYIVVGLGERPDYLPGGYNLYHPRNINILNRIIRKLIKLYKENGPLCCRTDVDQGFGQLFTVACLSLKAKGYDITLTAIIPREGMEKIWPQEVRSQYLTLLSACDEVIHISKTYYVGCMQDWMTKMLDGSDILLAGYNKGNTYTKKHIQEAKNKNIITSIISIT